MMQGEVSQNGVVALSKLYPDCINLTKNPIKLLWKMAQTGCTLKWIPDILKV